uniref:DNA-directed RNA polymerase I subunit RPA12 n=1 Tax=Schistocephalus solidus TaxID=70667 RepID=A0A0X3PT96_SCHSO
MTLCTSVNNGLAFVCRPGLHGSVCHAVVTTVRAIFFNRRSITRGCDSTLSFCRQLQCFFRTEYCECTLQHLWKKKAMTEVWTYRTPGHFHHQTKLSCRQTRIDKWELNTFDIRKSHWQQDDAEVMYHRRSKNICGSVQARLEEPCLTSPCT